MCFFVKLTNRSQTDNDLHVLSDKNEIHFHGAFAYFLEPQCRFIIIAWKRTWKMVFGSEYFLLCSKKESHMGSEHHATDSFHFNSFNSGFQQHFFLF